MYNVDDHSFCTSSASPVLKDKGRPAKDCVLVNGVTSGVVLASDNPSCGRSPPPSLPYCDAELIMLELAVPNSHFTEKNPF